MLYDLNVDMSEIYAPVQANIIIRSQSGDGTNADPEKATVIPPYRAEITPPYRLMVEHPEPEVQMVISHVPTMKVDYAVDLHKLGYYLQNVTRQTSTKMCARGVRLALQAAGASFAHHPTSAADWGPTLKKIGYQKIDLAFDQPKKGDIYIIDRTPQHQHGHIAAYSGQAWVSDFKQRSHAVYKNANVTYSYYRLAESHSA